MTHHLTEHYASVAVNAPQHQVYDLFTHFNDFPKFMSFVKEVTYYDDQRSHWVVDIVGRHEWDAVNENWEKYRQIGWRSYNGLENTGRVTFETLGPLETLVDVFIAYNPPAGALGDAGEKLGAGSRFEDEGYRWPDSLDHGLQTRLSWLSVHLLSSYMFLLLSLVRERLCSTPLTKRVNP